MWLAPGIDLPRNSAQAVGALGHDRRFGRVHVQVAGARMVHVLRENPLEHAMQPLHALALDVARSAARLEKKQRVRVQRGDIEIVRIRGGDLADGLRIRLVLIDALLRIEFLYVADRHRVDQRALLCRRSVLQPDRLLNGRIGVRRFLGAHRTVQVRSPGPRLAPVADRAIRIALPCFAERANRLGLRERVHHLEALIEKRLRFFVG